jgi:hypothetical protein
MVLREYHALNQSAIDQMSTPFRGQEKLPHFEHWSRDEDFFSQARPRQAQVTGIDTRTDAKAAMQMWGWLQNPASTEEQK